MILPSYRVLADGSQFGVFLGLTRDMEPIIGLQVPGETSLVPLEFRILGGELRFESGCDNRVMWTTADCSGQAYVKAPTADSGVRTACVMLGATYAVAPDKANGNKLSIFKGTGSPVNPQPVINSASIQGGACTASGISGKVALADVIYDLETNHPPPYTME